MSKRINRSLILLAVFAAMMAALTANHSGGVSAQRAGVTTSMARNAAIVATTTEVLKETSEIRELAILRPVKSGAQSRPEIERMLIKNLNEETTPAEMHATELSLRKFGLAPNNFEYRQFLIKLLTEQVAGYYDARGREFHLADWLELESQKPVMAHELTHALQDQHFNLRRFEKWPPGDSDAELAAHALIEGDATLAMTIYMAKNPMVALAFSRSLTTGVSTEQYDQAPRAMRETLIFPYINGLEWATQLYKRGGWPTVSNAFTRLPLSSEQILHPEKYFNYERPVKVVLPDLSSLLNASQKAPNRSQGARNGPQQSTGTAGVPPASFASTRFAEASQRYAGSADKRRPNWRSPDGVLVLPASVRAHASGQRPAPQRPRSAAPQPPTANRPLPTASAWRRIESDVNGEWGYYLILDQFLNSPAESRRAAAGWAGDRYALYEGPGGQVFLAQVAVWDTENDAREFFDGYIKRTELRYPHFKETDSPFANLRREWSTSEGNVLIELRGQRVVILEGAPEGVDANAMAKAF